MLSASLIQLEYASKHWTSTFSYSLTPHILARSGGVQAERAQEHTHTPTPQPRVVGRSRNPSPKDTHLHHTPRPGLAVYKPSGHTSTHTPQHPTQVWQAAAETRAQAHTPTPHTRARSGRVQAECAHKHTHTPTPQPGVAGRSQKPDPKHTHPRRTHQPGVAGYMRSAHTNTHTPQHPSQEWRGAAET